MCEGWQLSCHPSHISVYYVIPVLRSKDLPLAKYLLTLQFAYATLLAVNQLSTLLLI
ncbi:hypothetical protein SAMN05216167_101898 [Spirosoma endophyticum]|uniref:Uncharacterized protein n=1 Tax=Spirosoma endophyticum TaxID=662367 RepID=A0A1I1IAS7_9BACT|nr:hypothetical protein SAMN05216167_101898 [Spirosoma endophyticum]